MSLADQQWCPTSVQVTVLQARGLRIKGKSGTNDAYAVMQVGKEKFQTSVVEKSVAPVWKEEAAFDLPPLLHGAHGSERSTLHVHVLHRALVGPDKLLGQAVINLLQLSEDKTRSKTEWFKLLDKTGKPDKDRGEVLLDIQFMRNNMTASMFDLSAAGKSRSRLGKFKDKVRGKKKESDSGSNTLPSFTQVLTDSEEEANGGEVAASKDGKKKHKMKSLFSPKSNLQKNMSQSMSVLPAKNSTLSGSQSSGLNVDSSEGKKKFKFKIHKRSGSSDTKDPSSGLQKQLPAEQSNLCINGSHIYCEEPPTRTSRIGSNFSLASSGHGSMEEVPENSPPSVDSLRAVRQYSPWTEEEEEEVENIKEDESRRMEEERMRMEEEEKDRRQQEELEKLAEEEERRRVEEQKAKREEEERERLAEEKRRLEEQERRKIEEENERRQREEEEKMRMEEERAKEERRRRQEEERVRREEERKLVEEKRRLEEEERRRIEEEERRREEERAEEERRQREEEERVRKEKEEYERLMEEKRKLEDEKKRIEAEERRKRMEEERMRKEEQERKQRDEEEMRRQEEEERVRKEREEYERLMEEKRKLEEEKERIEAEEKLRKEEEERVREEEKRRQEEEERMQREEEERIRKEELRRQEEEEKARKEKEEYERLMEEKRKVEDEKKRIEAEERIRKEEEERIRMEEEMRRQEEEERVRKEKEEYERLVEEKRKLEEEKERIKAEEKLRKEEEERIGMEEERRKEEERVRKEKEEYERLIEEKRKLEEEKERIEAEEKLRKEEEERIRMEEERRKEEEEKRRREEQERIRVEEEKRQKEEEERRQEEERARKEKEEYERLEEERRKEEEQRRRIEEEERIRKEEQERIKMEEKKKRQEEEERARKEKEEMERLAEERQRKKEEEKRRIEEEKKVRREEEERMRRERKEKEEARRLEKEKLKGDAEEQKKKENKDGQKAAGKKSKLNSSAEVYSTNPFDENYSYNPFEEIPDSPPGAREETVQQRCRSAVSPLGSKTVPTDEKELVSAQREKRPAPQPPGRNQAEKPSQSEQDASARHPGQINTQNKDKDLKTVSVAPQRSVQVIVPVGRSPADSKNGESLTQSSTAKETTGKHGKRPAPARPRSVEEEPKTTSTAETKQTVYGLNPFEDDEDENDAGPACWPPAADKDAASQTKTKSSKVARAPPPPQNNGTLITQNTEGGNVADDTVPDGAANEECDPQPEAVNPGQVQESPVQNTVEACVKKEGPPVAARRLQPVKPLNSVEQQSVSVVQGENKSTGTHSEAQDKAKVNDSGLKGPFSQLTQEELISLVLKQENQLSERDKKISELEQYIDNLLVRVIEEQPSILMSLNSLKKAA